MLVPRKDLLPSIAVGVAAASVTSLGLAKPPQTIPVPFREVWVRYLAGCSDPGETDETITAARIRYYEAIATVRSVRVVSPREIVIEALRGWPYDKDKRRWPAMLRLSLADGGQSLSERRGADRADNLVRCPSSHSSR